MLQRVSVLDDTLHCNQWSTSGWIASLRDSRVFLVMDGLLADDCSAITLHMNFLLSVIRHHLPNALQLI